jgi:hypothetical protein
MPTPFTHLRTAERLLHDPEVTLPLRTLLQTENSAFLLGNVAADARVDSGMQRADTHFYHYDEPITQHAWRVMLERHPTLTTPNSAAHQAFLAGYVAHLSMDEIWLVDMLRPHFVEREWATQQSRFFMLHIVLVYMDERDYGTLDSQRRALLQAAQPDSWLPFMSDEVLKRWGNFIAEQLPPGESQTLEVFGASIHKSVDDFRAVLDSPEHMQADLWDNITPATLAGVEARMYNFAREQMLTFFEEMTL